MFNEKITAQKKILRNEIKSRLKTLSQEERIKFSRAVVEKFLASTVYKNSAVIMAYLSTAEEIELQEFILTALEQGKILAVPFIERHEMQAVILPNLESLEIGAYGIFTVKSDVRKFICAEKIDCVITPGLAFDAKRRRLGKGGGYYDKFLPSAINATKVALAYDCQIVENVPALPYDSVMNFIITPTQNFNGE